MRKALLAAAGAVGLAAGSAHAALPPTNPQTVTIGVILGGADDASLAMRRGAQFAIDEINAADGIDGVRVDLAVATVDTEEDPAAALQELVDRQGVQAVLTSLTASTLSLALVAAERGVLIINGGGVPAPVLGSFETLLHNRLLPADLGRAAAVRARELGLSRMAQLAPKTATSRSVIAAVEEYWRQLGGGILGAEYVEPDAVGLDAQIAKIRARNPDFITLWMLGPDTEKAVERIRAFGMQIPVIGIESRPDAQVLGGELLEGYEYVADHFTPAEANAWGKRFAAAYRAQHGQGPDYFATNYYEGVYLIAEAIRRARANGGGWHDGRKLAAALRANPRLDTVYGGTMVLADHGVVGKPAALFKVQGGRAVFQRYLATQ